MTDRSHLLTELRLPESMNLDALSIEDAVKVMNEQDARAVAAVAAERHNVAQAIEMVAAALRSGGRLIYVGAGTSGRLGVLDASECPPTFGSDPDMVLGVIAGGYTAVVRAVEGAEDRADQGAHAMDDLEVGPEDTVVGLAASRRTPYVVSAIARARSLGARTVYVTCTPREEFTLEVDVAICPMVGPEVLMGSTRMKAGTAQKLVCNMLSTASFVRIGKAYENMMVDLMANSQKLVERGRRTVMTVTGCDYATAGRAIEAAGKSVKTAIVMVKLGCSREEAERRLAASDGFVRGALGPAPGPAAP